MKLINDIIYNEDANLVALFKDKLIEDDLSEFLRRFYTQIEIVPRFHRITEYYNECSKIFPNYTTIQESKYIYKNIKRKQKLINNQQEGLAETPVPTEPDIFDSHLNRSIDNVSEFTEWIASDRKKEVSLYDLENIIANLSKADETRKSKKFVPKRCVTEMKKELRTIVKSTDRVVKRAHTKESEQKGKKLVKKTVVQSVTKANKALIAVKTVGSIKISGNAQINLYGDLNVNIGHKHSQSGKVLFKAQKIKKSPKKNGHAKRTSMDVITKKLLGLTGKKMTAKKPVMSRNDTDRELVRPATAIGGKIKKMLVTDKERIEAATLARLLDCTTDKNRNAKLKQNNFLKQDLSKNTMVSIKSTMKRATDTPISFNMTQTLTDKMKDKLVKIQKKVKRVVESPMLKSKIKDSKKK